MTARLVRFCIAWVVILAVLNRVEAFGKSRWRSKPLSTMGITPKGPNALTTHPIWVSRGGGGGESHTPENGGEEVSLPDELRDLVRDKPKVLVLFGTVLDFYWKYLLPKLVYHPLVLVGYCLAVWTSRSLVAHQRVLRALWTVAGVLPLVVSGLYLAAATYFFTKGRKGPSQAAQSVLLERIRSGRAARLSDGSDVFYPKPSKRKNHKHQTTIGMILFPGALIHHSAYAPVASKLSDEGITVIVQSLEPTRFVASTQKNRNLVRRSVAECRGGRSVDEWVLAGHSAGATTAYNLAAAAAATDTARDESLDGAVLSNTVVLWGHGRNEFLTQGRTLAQSACRVLVLNASEDGIVNSVSPALREAFRASVPPTGGSPAGGTTTYATIEGGNHAGFADYGHQPMDGNRTIPLDDQHRGVVRETARFVLDKAARRWF